MKFKKFKDTQLSVLGMGNMRLPVANNAIDYTAAKAIIDEAMRQGVNYYDTAYIYHGGKSEEFVGKALKDYPRDSYYVADKYNFQAQPDYKIQFDEQLNRLQMDRIDFYLLHGIQDNFIDDILTNGAIEYFHGLKQEGKIKYLGFSYHGNLPNLQRMLDAYDWDFIQIQLNYYDWELGEEKTQYEMISAKNIPIIVMEPVHGGLLAKLNDKTAAMLKAENSEASLASWAMRWVFGKEHVQVALSGMSTMEQLTDNCKTADIEQPLTQSQEELLKNVASSLRADVTVPCTACRYCVPDCPVNLEIPTLLAAYNSAKPDTMWKLSALNHTPKEKHPSQCIQCGSCTAHCPQTINVPAVMQEMAEAMEKFK